MEDEITPPAGDPGRREVVEIKEDSSQKIGSKDLIIIFEPRAHIKGIEFWKSSKLDEAAMATPFPIVRPGKKAAGTVGKRFNFGQLFKGAYSRDKGTSTLAPPPLSEHSKNRAVHGALKTSCKKNGENSIKAVDKVVLKPSPEKDVVEKPNIPEWAETKNLTPLLRHQYSIGADLSVVFQGNRLDERVSLHAIFKRSRETVRFD
ncbi:hypothetical protein BV898_07245 [Hypsibius exemplaris]|uniref:Uncharacterized protein n=1 Tax=Hypsibius exemplaris TaxID=2072580 RepID=A0A1W0WTT9_HYPEX|nr:hypothetical protein BV898_07245 [Hypsibius exemplaris]